MIVRLMGEGQYEVANDLQDRLNAIDELAGDRGRERRRARAAPAARGARGRRPHERPAARGRGHPLLRPDRPAERPLARRGPPAVQGRRADPGPARLARGRLGHGRSGHVLVPGTGTRPFRQRRERSVAGAPPARSRSAAYGQAWPGTGTSSVRAVSGVRPLDTAGTDMARQGPGRRGSEPLLGRRQRARVLGVAGVDRAGALEVQHVHLAAHRARPVLDATRDDEQLARLEHDRLAGKVEQHPPVRARGRSRRCRRACARRSRPRTSRPAPCSR